MTPIDRTTAPDDVFGPLLARVEAEEPVDIAADAAVENVARAICLAAYHGEPEWIWDRMGSPLRDDYLRLATAALAAMSPADETLREKVEALADEWTSRAMNQGGWYEAHYQSLAASLRAALGGSR